MPARISFRIAFVSALCLALPLAAAAQESGSTDVRAVRLTSSQGTVTVTDGDNPPVPAQMNLPLLQGVQIATGDDGQAEIEFEDGSVARLTPNSTLSLDKLDVAPGQIFVTDLSVLRGLAYFELRATPEYVYTVDAGGDVVTPVENATLRIDYDQPPASIAVMDGTAQVQTQNGSKVDVVAGSTLRQDATGAYSVTQEITADSWDQWNADMDQEAARQSADSTGVRNNYAGAQGYGWGDLDANGTWYNVPGQGDVWQPYVADSDSDFDPYGNGAWVSYPGVGYLWASAYPWGWTPFYCGAWSYYDSFGWGWMPDAACGGFGWGFGGGYIVNIRVPPRGYRPIRPPVRRPGPVRPIIPVRVAGGSAPPLRVTHPMEHGPRQIAGVTATPIVRGSAGFMGGRANAGASLQRDFPIDRRTHTPAAGVVSSRSPYVYHVGGGNGQPVQAGNWRAQPNTAQTQQPGQAEQRTRGLQQNSGPAQQQATRPGFAPPNQTQPQATRPAFGPLQPNQTQQRQTYTPQPQHTQPVHPQYAPQQQRQNFSPPPHPQYAPQQQRQNFSPPPQQHYSPPPPPPPPPHVSAPPSAPSAPAGHR